MVDNFFLNSPMMMHKITPSVPLSVDLIFMDLKFNFKALEPVLSNGEKSCIVASHNIDISFFYIFPSANNPRKAVCL